MKTKADIESNTWEDKTDLKEVLSLIDKATTAGNGFSWIWWKNSPCKYVNIRIDMRDGGFVICDRDDKRITLDELKAQ